MAPLGSASVPFNEGSGAEPEFDGFAARGAAGVRAARRKARKRERMRGSPTQMPNGAQRNKVKKDLTYNNCTAH
jgi:hypothetical protein